MKRRTWTVVVALSATLMGTAACTSGFGSNSGSNTATHAPATSATNTPTARPTPNTTLVVVGGNIKTFKATVIGKCPQRWDDPKNSPVSATLSVKLSGLPKNTVFNDTSVATTDDGPAYNTSMPVMAYLNVGDIATDKHGNATTYISCMSTEKNVLYVSIKENKTWTAFGLPASILPPAVPSKVLPSTNK